MPPPKVPHTSRAHTTFLWYASITEAHATSLLELKLPHVGSIIHTSSCTTIQSLIVMSTPPLAGPPLTSEYLAANKSTQTLIAVVLIPVLALIIVALRPYTRVNIVKSPSHEDIAIALAMVRLLPITLSLGLIFPSAVQCRLFSMSEDP